MPDQQNVITPNVKTSEQEEQERTIFKKKLFLDYLERTHGFILAVSEKTEVSRATIYNWRKKDKVFKKAMDSILNQRKEVVLDRVYGKAMSGDVGAMKYYLSYIDRGKEKLQNKEVHIYHHMESKDKDLYEKVTIEDVIQIAEKMANHDPEVPERMYGLFGMFSNNFTSELSKDTNQIKENN